MIDCKEVIIKQNEDSTYKVEFNECKFVNNGEKVSVNLIFPKVLKTKDGFILGDASEKSEIFTIYIPD